MKRRFALSPAAAVFVAVLANNILYAGAPVPPPWAPPLATPLPGPQPVLGAPYPAPPVSPGEFPSSGSALHEITICHTSFAVPGTEADWVGTSSIVVIQNQIGADRLHFKLCQNFLPPPGPAGAWNVLVLFGAAPMGLNYAFNLNPMSPFHTTKRIDDPLAPGLPLGSFAYMIVLTNADGNVADFLDPILITGTQYPPTVPTFTLPDHFRCYSATGNFQPKVVSLADQFESRQATVLRPDTLCNPVDKDREGISAPGFHLTCFEIRDARGEPDSPKREVLVQNQFGIQILAVTRPQTLCVPSFKVLRVPQR